MLDANDVELPEVTVPEIDRAIKRQIAEKQFSAAACVASQGGNIFHRGVYGKPTSLAPARPIDHTALFDLASLSKPLGAGLAALYLCGRGRFDLTAPLSRALPELRDTRFDEVTIEMLLDHSAGFPAVVDLWKEIEQREKEHPGSGKLLTTPKAVEIARKRLATIEQAYPPGKEAIYSDVGFMALGWILEDTLGKPLDLWLQRELYGPLGIADDLTFICLDDPRAKQRLLKRTFVATEQCPWRGKVMQGEVHDPNCWALGGVTGHAGLFGTADAVWRLVHHLWACFQGEASTFNSGVVRRFWTRSKRVPHTTRTLAWDTPDARAPAAGQRFSRNSVGHLGFTGTSVWIDLSTGVIGVLLTNAIHPSAEGRLEPMRKIRAHIYDLIAKEGESFGR